MKELYQMILQLIQLYSLLALKHPVPLPSFENQFCKLTYSLNKTMNISSISTIKANLKK